ncbi:MAG: heme lyase CcmF/NrfE family subunit [Rhodothalassiaceae bacterium]
MTAELGHLALWLALGLALIAATLPHRGLATGDSRLVALPVPLTVLQAMLCSFAFVVLILAFWRSDFSLALVAANSHSDKPTIFKIAGAWGNHEGSLLMWLVMLTGFGAAVALTALPARFKARVLSVQSLLTLGFLAFLLLTSNPFLRLDPAPPQGNGLNPLLQDIGLALHPPLLYVGYVGFSIAFSFAVAALMEGDLGPAWARYVRPWTIAAWVALTGGIALGSGWAYYELGWGGWWFWDPVENASFMPWLAGTALVHSVIVVETRDSLKSWTILLAVLTFSLSMLGTFLVRSGVLTSVHAFAVDPERGIFVLGLLGLYAGGALALYAWRAPMLAPAGLFRPVSREGGLVLNNLLLTIAAGIVLIGTLYPLILDAVTGDKISVGAPFFNIMTLIVAPLLILGMAIGPRLAWRRGKIGRAVKEVRLAGIVGLVVALAALVASSADWAPALGLGLGVGLIVAVMQDVWQRTKGFKRGLPLRGLSLSLGHFGLAVVVLGIAGSSAFTEEYLGVLQPGDRITLAGYDFEFQGVRPVAGKNYAAIEGRFLVERGGRTVARMHPQARHYGTPVMETTEAAIRPLPHADLYAVMGDPGPDGWAVRLYVKPLLSWIWAGALIMALSGILAIAARRRARAAAAASPKPRLQEQPA